jgi:phosphonate ABC transporter permease subunit PhnE
MARKPSESEVYDMSQRKIPSLARSLLTALAIIIAVVIYAYGVEVTQVDLSQTQQPRRIVQLTRIIRAIARPAIFEYEQTELAVRAPFYQPCPAGGYEPPPPDTSGPYIVVTPACADEREEVRVEGFNFQPNVDGPLDFVPPSGVRLQLGNVATDSEGHFSTAVRLRSRASPEEQSIQVTLRANVGGPRLTQTAHDTWDKILETVFLALLATTIGIALAIPVSFFAASNLMRPITSPLVPLALTLLALPLGIYLGAALVSRLAEAGLQLGAQPIMGVGALVISPLVVWGAARWALPQVEETKPAAWVRAARTAALVLAAAVVFVGLGLAAVLAQRLGEFLAPRLGSFGFLGFFLAVLGDTLELLLPAIGGLAGGFGLVTLAGPAGELLSQRLPPAAKKILGVPLAALAAALYFALIGAAIGWLYELPDPTTFLFIPAAVGGALGLAWAVFTAAAEPIPIGAWIYYVTRMVLNALRSIEPLIMVIVFAVWVGIGPFAGTLALALHTIAALGKLYSEQVESILPGPLEAIQATGATRLQTVVYAVVPQVVPPFISFTMYRWDINVRMSTIIGFAGGGGIGFLLQQNINLLQYRAAAVQMLAIAVVVATMDYLSAKLRERVI